MVISIDLRIGTTPFEFWHEFGEDQINVTNSRVFVESKKLVLSCIAKPIDTNQRSDAISIFRDSNEITRIVITDERVCEKFVAYAQRHRDEFDTVEFSIVFANQQYRLPVKASKDGYGSIVLKVQA